MSHVYEMEIKPNHILIIQVPAYISEKESMEQAQILHKETGAPVIVLSEGYTLSSMSREELERLIDDGN